MNDLEPSKGGLPHAQYLDPTNDNNLIWAAWGWAASDTQPNCGCVCRQFGSRMKFQGEVGIDP